MTWFYDEAWLHFSRYVTEYVRRAAEHSISACSVSKYKHIYEEAYSTSFILLRKLFRDLRLKIQSLLKLNRPV